MRDESIDSAFGPTGAAEAGTINSADTNSAGAILETRDMYSPWG
jgi:hypothetical protein